MRNRLQSAFLGRVPYPRGLELQEERIRALREGRAPEALFLLEHDPVITLGSGSRPEHVRISPAERSRRGIDLVVTDRGGDVTYHGPGQLVGYPILDLAPDRKDLGRYLRDLEEVLIRALQELGLPARRSPGWTGVWLGDEKVAAIGVRVSRWITKHGFALNVRLPARDFETIVPCGIQDRGVTDLARWLEPTPGLEPLAQRVAHHFGEVFDRELETLSSPPRSPGGDEVARLPGDGDSDSPVAGRRRALRA